MPLYHRTQHSSREQRRQGTGQLKSQASKSPVLDVLGQRGVTDRQPSSRFLCPREKLEEQ